VPNQDSKVHVGMSREEYQQWKEFNLMIEFRQQQQGQLSPVVDPTPSWKPKHPANEEQKGVQWTMQVKAEEIASRQQTLMDWLTPLYATKVPTIELESPIAMADRPAAEQRSPIVVEDKPVAKHHSPANVESNSTAKGKDPIVAEEGLTTAEEIPAVVVEYPAG
jgi:hypothetical protein